MGKFKYSIGMEDEMSLKLQSDYYDKLDNRFYTITKPSTVSNPVLVLFNSTLASQLGMELADLDMTAEIFSGNYLDDSWKPISQAYSGHQFGYFTRLGDGRAVLLGEWKDKNGYLWDIQLKGSGRNAYSRGGDGRATIGSMIREYIISEAMHGLGIPTTRSLAVVQTENKVRREVIKTGGILTRVASSHIRVGTFQYAYEVGGIGLVKQLADYAINRHYPHLDGSKDRYLNFLDEFTKRQAKLISLWMSKGFIHGVMNTDNMTISGETIDYGPCAFMDYYNPDEVFSSIDTMGRYRYSNQPKIGIWNIARLLELFVEIIDSNEEKSIAKLSEIIKSFNEYFSYYYSMLMRSKLGLVKEFKGDLKLIEELLQFMYANNLDFTNTFRILSQNNYKNEEVFKHINFLSFEKKWMERLEKEESNIEKAQKIMKNHNPQIIPRNHLVEKAIREVEDKGDYSFVRIFMELLKSPFDYSKKIPEGFLKPMDLDEKVNYKTYCGT